jgi:hypothetical protein
VSVQFACKCVIQTGVCCAGCKNTAYGRQALARGFMNALKKVMMTFASEVQPKWIQPAWKPQIFNFKEELKETDIFVGVLLASDGNSNYAVIIHGGFIYNANEWVAIPLCQEALDYIACVPTEKSLFVEFQRGIMWLQ